MRILIIGGSGMLGHQFLKSWQGKFEVKTTLHHELNYYKKYTSFDDSNSYSNVNILDIDLVEKVISDFLPHAVVNCVGITKQIVVQNLPINPILINSVFPHQLSRICRRLNSRLILLSTDCVFSGKQGFYKEGDISDAEDLYGRSKFLGEVDSVNVLTLRKSTIGLELNSHHGLIEWFLKQKGSVNGYTKAIYSGVTSKVLADIIKQVLIDYPGMHGIWNLASEAINKYSLLDRLNGRLDNFNIDIQPDDKIVCDRSLDASKFEIETGYLVPKWDSMLDDLAEEINEREK